MSVSLRSLLSCALVLLLGASPAFAVDPATEAALEADRVNQEHCADLYSRQVGTVAQAMRTVSKTWEYVSEIYEETGAPYLLYWRGTLAQCLGQEAQAKRDLQAFVDSQIQQTMFASLVRNAQGRLRRIEGDGVGLGMAAIFVREGHIFEGAFRYLGGSGAHVLWCTDDGTASGQVENTACLGGLNPRPVTDVAAVPLGFELELEGYFARFIGIGARAIVTNPLASRVPTERSPGAHLDVRVGPRIRILPLSVSQARAGFLRVDVDFAAAFGRIEPLAGSVKYHEDLQGFLDAGSYPLVHAGVGVRLEGGVELGPGVLLTGSGRFAWFVPNTPERSIAPSPVELYVPIGGSGSGTELQTETVERDPAPLSATRLDVGGRVGLVFPVLPELALGPFLDVGLQRTGIRFPDDRNEIWCASDDEQECVGDSLSRKVFSTRRDDVYARLGIEVRFGAGRHE